MRVQADHVACLKKPDTFDEPNPFRLLGLDRDDQLLDPLVAVLDRADQAHNLDGQAADLLFGGDFLAGVFLGERRALGMVCLYCLRMVPAVGQVLAEVFDDKLLQ
jgi:hypothetical protein